MRKRVLAMLVFLIMQFILGMSMNLFAVTPDDPKFSSEPVLIKLIFPSHVIVALLLIIGSIVIFAMSFRDKIAAEQRKMAGQGLATIIFALGGGLATVFLKGAGSEIASLVMAISFLASFIAYGRFYYIVKSQK
jgi:heme A synthase